MENLEIPETLIEDDIVPKMGQAENPCDKTLDGAAGLSSSIEPSQVFVGENDGGFDAKTGDMGIVEVLNGETDVRKGIEGVEGVSKESHIEGMRTEEAQLPKSAPVINGEEAAVEKSAMEDMEAGNASYLSEVDPAAKKEISGNGISLFVEVFGPPSGSAAGNEVVPIEHVSGDRSAGCVDGNNLPLFSDNTVNRSVEVTDVHDSISGARLNGTTVGEATGRVGQQVQTIYNEESEFSIGYFVWVKTKTQSWWPGMIVDPSYAPKDDAKSELRASLLVKYFGLNSYVWCSPSQLMHFAENFEQMSAHSKSRSFLGAVEKAVDEFGRLVKLKMSCSCLKNSKTVLSASLAGNGGRKEGILMPKDKMFEVGQNITQFEPTNFLALVKCLAHDVSTPGKLKIAATQNCLSAFYSFIGHHQLPMHQLRGTSDVKHSAENGLKQSGVTVGTDSENKVEDLAELHREEKDIVLNKCKSVFSEEGIALRSCNKEENLDSEVRNGSLDIADVGGSGGKSKKGYESRERRRSKYLSPPYVNLNWASKNFPGSEENQEEEGKGGSQVGQGISRISVQPVGSPPTGKHTGKKLKNKISKKAIHGPYASGTPEATNASSLDMLSELRFAALDCYYPSGSKHFDSADRFFSEFRRFVFHEKPNQGMDDYSHELAEESAQVYLLQTLPGGEVPIDKAKEMVEGSRESWETNSFAGTPHMNDSADYPGSVGHPSHNVTKGKGRKKKKLATANSNNENVPGFSDAISNLPSGSSVINFQETGCLAPDVLSVPKKRKKAGKTPKLLHAKGAVDLPDLNGNSGTPGSLVQETQATELIMPDKSKLKKKRVKAASVRSRTKNNNGVADVNGNNPNLGSLMKDVQLMGPSSQLTGELNKEREGAASLDPNSKADTTGKNAESSSFVEYQRLMGLASPDNKPGPKKRKRKRKEKMPVDHLMTEVSPTIPDLNGNAAEPNSVSKTLLGVNTTTVEGKPQRKRRRRNKPVSGTVPVKGDTSETALLLRFAPGFPVPSKEALAATFCGFGPVNESETQPLNDSGTAQVVFISGSDARDAFRSLEKSSPFGPALVNYRLHPLLAASRGVSGADADLLVPMPVQSKDGSKAPAEPRGLKPQGREAPDLFYIRKNLEMMTAMLEKSGDDLSPETRAQLESQIEALLKRVNTMVGSSPSP